MWNIKWEEIGMELRTNSEAHSTLRKWKNWKWKHCQSHGKPYKKKVKLKNVFCSPCGQKSTYTAAALSMWLACWRTHDWFWPLDKSKADHKITCAYLEIPHNHERHHSSTALQSPSRWSSPVHAPFSLNSLSISTAPERCWTMLSPVDAKLG